MRKIREAFLWEMGRCAICGTNFELSVHEIIGGPNRMRAFVVRAAWLATCSDCNCNKLTDRKIWPLAKQLAVKLEVDPAYFDLAEIRRLYAPEGDPHPPTLVTGDEVLAAYAELIRDRRPAA